MTFEDWLPSYYEVLELSGTGKIQMTKTELEEWLADAWNAAIASSLNAVDAVNKRNIDENDVVVYINEDIKALLTQ